MQIENADKKTICATCGTRYAPAKFDAEGCPVCLDDRQYMQPYGQRWLSYEELRDQHAIKINRLRDDLYELLLTPTFAIGQKAHLIVTPAGNVLWDCLPLLDEPTYAFIQAWGGLKAIAISHPHYYGLMAGWAKAFDCPIHLHAADREWVMDTEERVAFFEDSERELLPGIDVIHCGGHFPGSTVLHYRPADTAIPPTLLIGDTLLLSRDGKHLSVMYSFPNLIPLPARDVFRVFDRAGRLEFDSLFGAFAGQNVFSGAREILDRSRRRYEYAYGGR